MKRPFGELTFQGHLRRLRPMAEEAVRRWPLAEPRVRRLHYGENATYEVRDRNGGRRVLRIARPGYQSPEAIRSELWWVAQLREAGLDVPEPERGRDGEWVQTVSVPGVPEARKCVLLRWMSGRFLDAGLRPIHLERLGRVIARVHEVGLALDLPADFSRQPWDPRGLLGPGAHWGDTKDCVHLGEGDREWAARESARVRALLESYGTGADRFGLIHADLHYGNILFHQGRPRLIDFDDCGLGFFAHDLMTPISNNDQPYARVSLLSGYSQVRPLPPDFDRFLPILRQAQRLRSIGWLGTRSDNPGLRRIAVDAIPKILKAARQHAPSIG